jgi:3-oxoacyl-[acyl-carrier protein] reductase
VDFGLDGKVALVTGASQGIGRAIAAELVRERVRVAITSRSRQRVDDAASAIGAHGFVHDNDDVSAAARLCEEVRDLLGPIDVLVTNSGGPPANPDALALPRESWESAYRQLVLTPMSLIESTLPGMRRRRWGRVVNVASTTVREVAPALMLSNTHRSAILAAFKTIARQVARDGVTLNTVLTGRIDTDRLAQLYGSRDAATEMAEREVPTGRLGSVDELAAAATFLCSGRAGYITGATLLVDGGLTRSI